MYFDGENILFDASLVIYINSTNIPPIMIINRIYENQNLLYIDPPYSVSGSLTTIAALYQKVNTACSTPCFSGNFFTLTVMWVT